MMVQVRKQQPMSPSQASSCCGPADHLLDPELFKALGDPTRTQLLGCLIKCGRACSVSELAACCHVDLSVVSRHLQHLERAGLLEGSKAGRTVSYIVRYQHLASLLRSLAEAISSHQPTDAAACTGPCNCSAPITITVAKKAPAAGTSSARIAPRTTPRTLKARKS